MERKSEKKSFDPLLEMGDIVLLKNRVYNIIKTEIILGRYKPGDKLNIIDISSSLNISCAPVREAFSMLIRDGLITQQPYKTAVVSGANVSDWSVCVELRKMLEPYVTYLSTPRIPDEALEEAREKLYKVLENPSDMVAYVDSDMFVHDLLYSYADSPLLSEVLNRVKSYTIRIRYLVEESLEHTPESLAQVCLLSTREHLKIVDALEKRDPEAAKATVLSHIENYIARCTSSDGKLLDPLGCVNR